MATAGAPLIDQAAQNRGCIRLPREFFHLGRKLLSQFAGLEGRVVKARGVSQK